MSDWKPKCPDCKYPVKPPRTDTNAQGYTYCERCRKWVRP